MSEKIKITCPRCGGEFERSLTELENIQEGYREIKAQKPKTIVVKYRAVCPTDGTYIILEVEEE